MVNTSNLLPWQNGHVERLTGSIRRECLDHVVVLGERHLRHLLANYAAYYNGVRTHLSLDKDTPLHRPVRVRSTSWSHSRFRTFAVCGFRPRSTGGSAQKFRCTEHRQQFWIAARRWTMRAIEAGLLSVDCLKASCTSVHAA